MGLCPGGRLGRRLSISEKVPAMANKKIKRRAPKAQGRVRKTASSFRLALPSLSLAEETLKQIEAQVKDRCRHPARAPRL